MLLLACKFSLSTQNKVFSKFGSDLINNPCLNILPKSLADGVRFSFNSINSYTAEACSEEFKTNIPAKFLFKGVF